jgi:APA family basic amino acid/polyamine antiporter
MAVGLFTLRKRPDYRPVYRVWGFPWVPGVFIAASTVIVINRMVSEPIDSLVGLAIVAAGVPAYYAWVRSTRRRSIVPQPM